VFGLSRGREVKGGERDYFVVLFRIERWLWIGSERRVGGLRQAKR
jgi:hypothetical protein